MKEKKLILCCIIIKITVTDRNLKFVKMYKNKVCVFCSPEGLEQDSASASSGGPLRGRSAVGRKHRFDLAARTLLARAGKNIPQIFTFPHSLSISVSLTSL